MIIIIIISYTVPGRGQKCTYPNTCTVHYRVHTMCTEAAAWLLDPIGNTQCTHPHTSPVHNRDHPECLQSGKFQTLLSLHRYLPSPPNWCHQIELFETNILVYGNSGFAAVPPLNTCCPQPGTTRVHGLRGTSAPPNYEYFSKKKSQYFPQAFVIEWSMLCANINPKW